MAAKQKERFNNELTEWKNLFEHAMAPSIIIVEPFPFISEPVSRLRMIEDFEDEPEEKPVEELFTYWIRPLSGDAVPISVKRKTTIEEAQWELWQTLTLPIGQFPEIVVGDEIADPYIFIERLEDQQLSYIVTEVVPDVSAWLTDLFQHCFFQRDLRMMYMCIHTPGFDITRKWRFEMSTLGWTKQMTRLLASALRGSSCHFLRVDAHLDLKNGLEELLNALPHTNLAELYLRDVNFAGIYMEDMVASVRASALSSFHIHYDFREQLVSFPPYALQLQRGLQGSGIIITLNGTLVVCDYGDGSDPIIQERRLIGAAFVDPTLENAIALREAGIVANVRTVDEFSETLVHRYARARQVEGLKVLLALGCRTDITDKEGRLPIDESVRELLLDS